MKSTVLLSISLICSYYLVTVLELALAQFKLVKVPAFRLRFAVTLRLVRVVHGAL